MRKYIATLFAISINGGSEQITAHRNKDCRDKNYPLSQSKQQEEQLKHNLAPKLSKIQLIQLKELNNNIQNILQQMPITIDNYCEIVVVFNSAVSLYKNIQQSTEIFLNLRATRIFDGSLLMDLNGHYVKKQLEQIELFISGLYLAPIKEEVDV